MNLPEEILEYYKGLSNEDLISKLTKLLNQGEAIVSTESKGEVIVFAESIRDEIEELKYEANKRELEIDNIINNTLI